ncbi:MAG: cytochrome b562 [Thalassotalea sp.]
MKYLSKLLPLTLIVSTLMFTNTATAVVPDEDSAVSKNFKDIGRSMRGLGKADNSQDIIAALEKIKAIATKNRKEVPSFMKADTKEFTKYQEGVDSFVETINKTIAAVNKGDITSGKQAQKKLGADKKKFHKEFDLEDDH